MQEDVTFYFCTKNRNNQLVLCLDSIKKFAPNSKIILGNASTGEKFLETSEIAKRYPNLIEIKYPEDPGMCPVYNEIYKMVDTQFAALWSDDLILLRPIDNLVAYFEDISIMLVALPMIDDLSDFDPSDSGWEVDEFGCALWNTGAGRCAHFSITRTTRFRDYNVCGSGEMSEVTDNFFHNNTFINQRVWPNDGAYVFHKRYTDETRINTQLVAGKFRLCEDEKNRFKQHLKILQNAGVKI
jgi:hypothetical protein